ncbi:hypothetical protein K449DRAFT_424938 [Hypoxylon sp. EC38]|nr:hypothetical protein K449DRAFT_424938 [Hypoxylon sp. EC38]
MSGFLLSIRIQYIAVFCIFPVFLFSPHNIYSSRTLSTRFTNTQYIRYIVKNVCVSFRSLRDRVQGAPTSY